MRRRVLAHGSFADGQQQTAKGTEGTRGTKWERAGRIACLTRGGMMESNLPEFEQLELSMEGMPEGMEILPEYEHRHTGEQVARDRARYMGIVSALAEGVGMNRVARMFRVSKHTIMAIREREPRLIATEKVRLGRACMATAEMCLDIYRDAVLEGRVKPEQLPIGGVAVMVKANRFVPGTYKLYIQDYRDEQGVTGSLTNSSAVLSITNFAEAVFTFNCPTQAVVYGQDQWWDICEINGATGAITTNNIIVGTEP